MRGPKAVSLSRLDGRDPRVRRRLSRKGLLVMSKKITTSTPPIEEKNKEQGWNNDTHLSVNLKTKLRSDRYAKTGKSYQGVLRRDVECEDFLYDEQFTFTEIVPPTAGKRNPHVFEAKFVSITRWDDGSYHPHLKQMPELGAKLSVDNYAFEVYRELRQGLKGLIEEG